MPHFPILILRVIKVLGPPWTSEYIIYIQRPLVQ